MLGGFSQGCVMSWALGLAAGRPRPAGIIGLSGFMPTVPGFELDLSGLEGYPVAIGHGSFDPVIGVEWGRQARDRMIEAGADVSPTRSRRWRTPSIRRSSVLAGSGWEGSSDPRPRPRHAAPRWWWCGRARSRPSSTCFGRPDRPRDRRRPLPAGGAGFACVLVVAWAARPRPRRLARIAVAGVLVVAVYHVALNQGEPHHGRHRRHVIGTAPGMRSAWRSRSGWSGSRPGGRPAWPSPSPAWWWRSRSAPASRSRLASRGAAAGAGVGLLVRALQRDREAADGSGSGRSPVSSAANLIGPLAAAAAAEPVVGRPRPRAGRLDWALVLYLGLICTLFAYIAWTRGAGHLDASRAVAYLYGVPPLAVLIGALTLGEEVTVWLAAGRRAGGRRRGGGAGAAMTAFTWRDGERAIEFGEDAAAALPRLGWDRDPTCSPPPGPTRASGRRCWSATGRCRRWPRRCCRRSATGGWWRGAAAA